MNENMNPEIDTDTEAEGLSDSLTAALNAEDAAFALATSQGQVQYLSRRVGELVSEVAALKALLDGSDE